MGHEQVVVAVRVEVAGVDAHAPFRAPVAIDRRPRQPRRVLEPAVPPVHPQLVGLAVVGHVEVRPAVAVDVGGHDPEGGSEFAAPERFAGDVGERPVAPVAIEPVGPRRVAVGPAPVLLAGPAEALQAVVEAGVDVVGHVEIEPAVAVEVGERRRRRPARVVRAAPRGDVGERPAAVVAEQVVAAEPEAVDVDPAVVVEVPGRRAHAVGGHAEAAPRGDVGEAQGAGPVRVDFEIVPVEAVGQGPPGPGRTGRRLVRRPAGTEHLALDEIDVEVAVVVEVEQRPARPHDLGGVVRAGHAVEMHEVEPRRRRPIREPRTLARRPARRRRVRRLARRRPARAPDGRQRRQPHRGERPKKTPVKPHARLPAPPPRRPDAPFSRRSGACSPATGAAAFAGALRARRRRGVPAEPMTPVMVRTVPVTSIVRPVLVAVPPPAAGRRDGLAPPSQYDTAGRRMTDSAAACSAKPGTRPHV